MENGTNQKKMVQLMDLLNTAMREAELEHVPMVKENGTTEEGRIKFSSGIRIKLAPPPQIALIQKATTVARNSRARLENMQWIRKVARAWFLEFYNGTDSVGIKIS